MEILIIPPFKDYISRVTYVIIKEILPNKGIAYKLSLYLSYAILVILRFVY